MNAFASWKLDQFARAVEDFKELEQRAARATGKGMDEFPAEVPSTEPPEWDCLPQSYQRNK